MRPTKTGDPLYRKKQSFDAPLRDGRTLPERHPDPNVRRPDEDAEAQHASDDDDDIIAVLEAVLKASTDLILDPKLVSHNLGQVFSASITGERTRQLLQAIYKNAESDTEKKDVLSYIFGLPHRKQVQSLELLAPAHTLWSSEAYQQNAWTLLNRTRATLRANLLVALASHNEDLFLRYLFLFGCQERWRKGTVDHLAAWREQLSTHAPEQAGALAGLTSPAIRLVVQTISHFNHLAKAHSAIWTFKSIYTALRYAGLFSPQDRAIDAADILHSATSELPYDGSAESIMLRRALKRPLHLLPLSDEWNAFIDELLDCIDDPHGEDAVFAAYTACYYLDFLDMTSWEGMIAPFSIERAWGNDALRAVLEESNKNVREIGYQDPHHAVVNTLRALNYIRAHPDFTPRHLGHRERNVCLHLARKGIQAASQLSHSRADDISQWCERLERQCSIPS